MNALTFLSAARAAMPKTLGDRFRIGKMNELMQIAIACKMSFQRDDYNALRGLTERCSVGCFYPMSEQWYSRAAFAGGTYCLMWERAMKVKPWMTPFAVTSGPDQFGIDRGRLAAGMGVLMPGPMDALPCFNERQVWWCTSIDWGKDTITLCRYPYSDGFKSPFVRHGGKLVSRWTISRADWQVLMTPAEPASRVAGQEGGAA